MHLPFAMDPSRRWLTWKWLLLLLVILSYWMRSFSTISVEHVSSKTTTMVVEVCNLKPYSLTVEHLRTDQWSIGDWVTIHPDTSTRDHLPRFSFKATTTTTTTPTPDAYASQIVIVRCQTPSCQVINEIVWDSGWVVAGRRNGLDIIPSNDTHNLPLIPMEILYWKARFGIEKKSKMVKKEEEEETRIQDMNILPCPWSDPYEPFLVGPSDDQWSQSEWICSTGKDNDSDDSVPTNEDQDNDCDFYDTHGKATAPIFRTEFELPSSSSPFSTTSFSTSSTPASQITIQSARLFVTGLGHYEAWMNGIHINQDRYLDPAPSSYDKRIYYNSFDVTHAMMRNQTKQSLGFIVGNGWWNPLPMKFWGHKNLRDALPVGVPQVRCILQVEYSLRDPQGKDVIKSFILYTNTTTTSSSSAGKWMTTDSGLLRNDLYLGNVVDLNRNDWLTGWSTVGFHNPLIHWRDVQTCPSSSSSSTTVTSIPSLPEPQPIPPIRSRPPHILYPQSITTIDNSLVMDMGKNTAAILHVEIIVPKNWVCSQQQIELKFGEILFPDGTVNVYTSVAGQIKTEGCCGPCAPPLAYQSLVLRTTKSANYTTQFSWSGFRYIQISSLPPGWEINVYAIPLMTNLEWTTTFESSNSHLNDIYEMCQNTHASNMMGIQSDCPHRERFGYTGDALATLPTSLAFFDGSSFYEKRLYDVLDSLRSNGGVTETAPFVGIATNGLGDQSGPIGWQSFFPHVQIALERYCGSRRPLDHARNDTRRWIEMVWNHTDQVDNGLGDWMATDMVPVAISGRMFLIQALRAWAVLTDSEEEEMTALIHLGDELKAFESRFVNENGDVTWQGSHPTQSGQAMTLFFNVIDNPGLLPLVSESLIRTVETAQRHITTGMFGVLPLLESLSMINQTNLAWDIIMQTDYPSYGYMLQNNATTLWESWFFSNNTFSHNHPMFSGVASWILSHIGGISVAGNAIGADRLIIAPFPPDGSNLTHSSMTMETARGLASCRWKCMGNGRMELSIQCPPNTRCYVILPDRSKPFEVVCGNFNYKVAVSSCELDSLMPPTM